MRLESGTWVLVLDGEKALILENVADGADPNLRQVAKDLNDDPGDPEETGSVAARASSDEHAARHQQEEPTFVTGVAERLYRDAHRGRFDRLVVVAGPEALGVFRKHLHPEVAGRIVAEVQKTLTKHPLPEIERIVSAEIADA